MNQQESGGNPILKIGLACCALLGLLIVGSCVGFGIWAQSLASVDPTKNAARYTATTGAALPASAKPKFSVDMGPMPMSVVYAAADEPKKLTLIAVMMPPNQNAGMPEHQMAWDQLVRPFGPQMQQMGVSLETANAMSMSNTGEAKDIDIEVGGKTFKGTEIPCKMSDGTALKRIYVKLQGGGGLFAIGSTDDFDEDAFKEALGGCAPR